MLQRSPWPQGMLHDSSPDVGIIVSDFASGSHWPLFFARERQAGSLLVQLAKGPWKEDEYGVGMYSIFRERLAPLS
jgi:hypothetical protein